MSFWKSLFGKSEPKPISTKVNVEKSVFIKKMAEQEPVCPYCGQVLDTMPHRKKKCNNCKETIHVYKVFPNDFYSLLTTYDKEINEVKWKEQSLENKYIQIFNQFGITESEFRKKKKNYFKTIGTRANLKDFIWSTFNEGLHTNAGNFRIQSNLYFYMAHYLKSRGNQGDYEKLIIECRKSELQHINLSGCKKVVIVANKSCPNCSKLDDKTLTIKEALKQNLLPALDCPKPNGYYCVTSYVGLV